MPIYKVADVVFDLKPVYKYTVKMCEKYLYSGEDKPEFTAVMTESDIAAERLQPGAETFPDYYIESLAVFRKLCDYTLSFRQGIIFHSSAIAVDGKAYLFTAPSGTGKSTHAQLWREMLGERAVMINDDKPIIRFIDGDFYVYGTPWNGKHHLDTNARAKIAAICEIRQGRENKIRRISPQEMLTVVFNQTIRPTELDKMNNLLSILDKLLTTVPLYRLECNISREAAETSYSAMAGNNINREIEK